MKLKKNYIHNNNRQIFRLIPTDTNKLIIEERETDKKQAYFNCLDINNGKPVFKHLQLPEKFWLGIETIYDDVIFFHKYSKPDLPQHNSVIAFDINSQKVLWENEKISFLFIKDEKLYAFQQNFEDREFFTFDFKTGKLIEELGTDFNSINLMREEAMANEDFSTYVFPEVYIANSNSNPVVSKILDDLREKFLISGRIEYALLNDLLLFNFHEIVENNLLNNKFKAVDLSNGKYILEETLNKHTQAFAPDSFFVKDDLLFLLIDRKKLNVYKILTTK